MSNDLYADICFVVVWCMRYVFIPIGVALSAKVIADKLFPPQPERQRKKRPLKNRFK